MSKYAVYVNYGVLIPEDKLNAYAIEAENKSDALKIWFNSLGVNQKYFDINNMNSISGQKIVIKELS